MTISENRSNFRLCRAVKAAIPRLLALGLCGVASPGLLAGFGKPSRPFSVFPFVADIDKDGQPGGNANPTTLELLNTQSSPGAPLDLLAALFFGDQAVSKQDLTTPAQPMSIAAFLLEVATDSACADLDCDGDEDLLAISFENLSFIRQQPGGTFAAPVPCAQVAGSPFGENCVKVTDLTGDKCPDIVSVSNTFQSPNNGLIQVFPNSGGGVFQSPTTLTIPGATFSGNAVGDIDGDGADEVAVISGASSVSILRRTAPGTLTPLNAATGLPLAPGDPFTLSEITFTPSLFEVVLDDVNNDGHDDILASNLNDIFIRPSLGNGRFGPIVTLDGDSGTQEVSAADLNNDGTAEVFAVNSNTDSVNLWRSNGPLLWGPRVDLPAGSSTSDAVLADILSDGVADDLVALNRADGDAIVILGKGFGDFESPQRFTNFSFRGGIRSTAVGDFNADGFADAVAGIEGGDMALFLNLADGSGQFQAPIVARPLARAFEVDVLPPPPTFPNNSPDRIAVGIPTTNTIAVFEYNPAPPPASPFSLILSINTGNIVDSITTTDVNADGVTDIAVVYSATTPAARVYLGTTTGTFASPIAVNLPTLGWDRFLAPPPDSGLPANLFFIADHQAGNVAPLTFNAGAFTAGTIIPFGANCTDFALGDIDADGVADLIALRTGSPGGTIIVQPGLTQAALPPQVSVPISRNGVYLAVGDINGDGKTDAIVATSGPSNQNQYALSLLNSGTALDPATQTLHPAGERPRRPLIADLHLPIGTERGEFARGGTDLSRLGPEAIIGNADSTNFSSLQSFIVLPNQIDFAPPPSCVGDANDDGVVNTGDLTLLLLRFGQTVTPGSPGTSVDFNGDGTVNTADLTLLLVRFGQACR